MTGYKTRGGTVYSKRFRYGVGGWDLLKEHVEKGVNKCDLVKTNITQNSQLEHNT